MALDPVSGRLYELTTAGVLNGWTAASGWTVFDRGVQSFRLGSNGILYYDLES
jgi:hypothetical protein